MKLVGLLGVVALAITVPPGDARADEAAIVALRDASLVALQEGRTDEAMALAVEALEAAEAELGDAPLTAQLAYNVAYGRAMRFESDELADAAARFVGFVEKGIQAEGAPAEAAAVLAALAEIAPRRRAVTALENAIAAYEATGGADPLLSALAWLGVAKAERGRDHPREAVAAAQRASDLLYPAPLFAAVQAAIAEVGAAAAQDTTFRHDHRLGEGLILVQRGIYVQPSSPRAESMPKPLARLMRWSLILERQHRNATDEEFVFEDPRLAGAPPWSEVRYGPNAACNIEWIERNNPEYPRLGLAVGFQPVTLIEFWLNPDGSVARAETLGDYDDPHGFTAAIVDALRTWRAAPPANADCYGPYSTAFEFDIR